MEGEIGCCHQRYAQSFERFHHQFALGGNAIIGRLYRSALVNLGQNVLAVLHIAIVSVAPIGGVNGRNVARTTFKGVVMGRCHLVISKVSIYMCLQIGVDVKVVVQSGDVPFKVAVGI